MSYLIFARKYRPQTFADLLGQEPIVTTLTNAIEKNKIGQAYLFAGPRGTGKTSTARIFAKSLNCVKGPTATPCLKCSACEEITQARSLDVLEIDGASNRGIDQIRALREMAKFTPISGHYKVYIIDEVHQITAEGFNALLKTLEEPPPHLVFILATTAPHKVPATILSRCQRYDFKRLPLEVITSKIKLVAAQEKLKIEEEAVLGIAKAASGSLRDAESLLDQVAAFTGGKIRGEDVQTLLGTIDQELFTQALQAIRSKEPVKLLQAVAQAANEGTDLVHWAISFLSFLRNVLVAKAGAGPLGFEDLGKEEIEEIRKLADQFSIEELMLINQVMISAVEMMRRIGEPRIPLEVALVRLSTGDSIISMGELVERLEKLDQQNRQGGEPPRPAAPAVAAIPAAVPDAPNRSPDTEEVRFEKVRDVWSTLLAELHQQKASVAAFLAEAVPVSLSTADPPELMVGFAKGFEYHRESLDRLATRQIVEETLARLIGFPIRLTLKMMDVLPQKPISAPIAPSPFSLDKAGNPLLNAVAELFEGRVLPGKG